MPVKPIPDGYHTVTPSLIADDAARLLDFLTKAFGAQERINHESRIDQRRAQQVHKTCLIFDQENPHDFNPATIIRWQAARRSL